MAALEPVFTAVIAAVSGGLGATLLRYFGFFRKNKVEDRTTETERLEAENARANKRADEAEANEERYYREMIAERQSHHREMLTTRRQLFDEQEYVARLRAQMHSEEITPYERG